MRSCNRAMGMHLNCQQGIATAEHAVNNFTTMAVLASITIHRPPIYAALNFIHYIHLHPAKGIVLLVLKCSMEPKTSWNMPAFIEMVTDVVIQNIAGYAIHL